MGETGENWLGPVYFFKENLLMDWTRVFRESKEPKMIPKLFSRASGKLELPFAGR